MPKRKKKTKNHKNESSDIIIRNENPCSLFSRYTKVMAETNESSSSTAQSIRKKNNNNISIIARKFSQA